MQLPFKIIIAAHQTGFINAVCGILRLLSLSCVITLTTDMLEPLLEHLQKHDSHLLILGCDRENASFVIREARQRKPKLRVLWVGQNEEPLPEADCTLCEPMSALRLIDAVSRALK